MDGTKGNGERASALPRLHTEVEVLRQVKQQQIEDMAGNAGWRERLRRDLEDEISRRVREALDTPPAERHRRNRELARLRAAAQKEEQLAEFRRAARAFAAAAAAATTTGVDKSMDSTVSGGGGFSGHPNSWLMSASAAEAARRHHFAAATAAAAVGMSDAVESHDDSSGDSADDGDSPGRWGPMPSRFALRLGVEAMRHFGDLSAEEKLRLFANFTRDGFREALRTGRLPDGSPLAMQADGRYRDQYGILQDSHGPFWPRDFGPCYPAPAHKRLRYPGREPLLLPLKNPGSEPAVTFDNQRSQFCGRWRGTQIVFDSERSSRQHSPQAVAPDVCPTLVFESRFESGNLRQARRV